ncbi:MAG: dihydrodipicolinate synthase family protein [Spirochaeta sp.]|jgi:4-hydroxy-tetrahydrodipicolinate synthase|nr:dihydrodipicolinate synthase family protein [Spirochaeta sp.]
MKTTQRPIEGIIPAPISVFDENRSFDYDGFARQIEYLVEGGVNGVFLTGTTAEGAYVTMDERLKAVETVERVAGTRVTIYAVIARAGTHQTLEELKMLAGTAVSYVASVTPYYMPTDQAGIMTHYRTLADESPVPFLLYNIPQNTHNPIQIDTVLELSKHTNIVGIKDSSGDFKGYTHGVLTLRNGFAWIQGEDLLDAPSFALGAPAIVTGLGNVEIAPYV